MASQLAQTYQRKTDKEHVLDNPDSYTGSIAEVNTQLYVLNSDNKIVEQEVSHIPALYKLFDEGMVNCRDHVVRMLSSSDSSDHQVSKIEVDISDDGTITLLNDGNGIDVAKHPEYDIWIPELVFGHLRTSTNYAKDQKRIVGGKNGFGFKLVLIWSTWGRVETVDHKRGLKYIQEFRDNLDIREKPSVTKTKVKPYTKVSFKPDYARLKIDGLNPGMVSLFKKRVYDIAAVTHKGIKVKLNNELLPVKTFQQYVDMYPLHESGQKVAYEQAGPRWEYAVGLAPNEEFTQVSFVNGIYTSKGGRHVEYVINQVLKKLAALIKKKKKIDVKTNTIKEQLMIWLRCDIDNPAFESQTKDYMNTPVNQFGSTCAVSDKFIEKISKMGVIEAACALTEVKETKAAKKTDGSKTRTIRGIPKLVDANWAGTTKASQCTLMLCEGDSAKAGIVSGLSKSDRDTVGVYPMRGKLFNVRGETTKRISENKEIAEVKKILGLESGKTYTTETIGSALRYGKVLFMTDQDLDGSHIKGLGINLFQSQWGSLAKIEGFLGFMNTPILKVKLKNGKSISFYSEGAFDDWRKQDNVGGWSVKYYKGLGTSTGKEFREYFESQKTVALTHTGEQSDNSIDMVFNKKRSEDRKEWLSNYDRTAFLDTDKSTVPFEEFIDREMIHFSKYDCARSIPNLMDGLKTSLRKILYSAFKKGNLSKEIKVAQFSGYVSEHSGYHHGEASLNGAIVGMAQDFVGSNNVNLLMPNGQFGTRLQGGKDSASERYIFTQLNPITRFIYKTSDDQVLTYNDDDGMSVEPVHYVPIIPMILINGSKGIGTGFSTDVASYNPLTLIDNILMALDNETLCLPYDCEQMIPYYEGFKGSIVPLNSDGCRKYLIKGAYEKINDNSIRVTELPIGYWTDDFKQHLENLITPPPPASGKKAAKPKTTVRDYSDMSTDKNVDITISFATGCLSALESEHPDENYNGVEKLLKLYTTHSTSNMHLFNEEEQLRKYNSPEDIVNAYLPVRMKYYQKRKSALVDSLQKESTVLSNKARYIEGTLNDEIDLRRKSKEAVSQMLQEMKFDMVDEDASYKYLVRMPMDSVTDENASRILKERDAKQSELDLIRKTTEKDMWRTDLRELREQYTAYKSKREIVQSTTEQSKPAKKKVKKLSLTTKPK
jgi:DNA topoisomerase-2